MKLYPPQQDALRKLVNAANEAQDSVFWNNSSHDGCFIAFGMLGGKRIDLTLDMAAYSALEASGLIEHVSKSRRRISAAAHDAVANNFAPPPPPSSPSSVHNTIHVHGPVSGGNFAQGVNVTLNVSEVARVVDDLRRAAEGVPDEAERAAVLEQIENIDDELKANTPKPAKLKTFLAAIGPTALKYAPLANAVASVAKLLGLPTN